MDTPWRWTAEIEVQLMRLAAAAETNPKLTYQVIADRLSEAFGTNISRNAIAGRLMRLKNGTRPVPRLPVLPTVKPKAPPPQPEPPAKEPAQTRTGPVTLLEREPWQCRWPVNDGNPYLFCGARKGDHDPVYCREHRSVATGRAWRRAGVEAP